MNLFHGDHLNWRCAQVWSPSLRTFSLQVIICWSHCTGIFLVTLPSSIKLGKLTEFTYYLICYLRITSLPLYLGVSLIKIFSFPYHFKVSFSQLCCFFSKPTRRDTFIWVIEVILWRQIKSIITTENLYVQKENYRNNFLKGAGIVLSQISFTW